MAQPRWTERLPGFVDPVHAAQATFRAALEAMARPGRIRDVTADLRAPAPLHPATAAVALTLLDLDTPVWTDLPEDAEAVQWCRFHCGAPLVADPVDAAFALITRPAAMPGLDRFHPGTDRRPETAATLVIQTQGLDGGAARRLTGPGIDGSTTLSPSGIPEAFWSAVRRQRADYPLGVDVLFTQGRRLAALPRTTRLDG